MEQLRILRCSKTSNEVVLGDMGLDTLEKSKAVVNEVDGCRHPMKAQVSVGRLSLKEIEQGELKRTLCMLVD